MAEPLQFRAQAQEQHQEGEGAADAGSAPAPAPKTTHTVNEDDQIIDDLRREHFAKAEAEAAERDGDEPEPEEEPKPKGKPKAAKKAKPEPEEGEDEPAQKAPRAPKYDSGDAAVSAIVKAIESGDAKAIAKALGKPDTFMDVSSKKWAAFRESQNAVRERERAVVARENEVNQRVAEVKKELGPAAAAAKAYQDGDLGAFVKLVEALTGESYDEAQRKVIKGHVAIDPEVKKTRDQVRQLREELAAERRKQAEEATKQTQAQKTQKVVDAITTELAGHRVSKVKGFQQLIIDAVRNSFDAETNSYSLSFEDAADEVMAEKDAEAESLGYSRAKAPAARQQPSASVPPRSRAAEARVPDGEPWAERDMTDDELIASIKRDVRSGRIKIS